MATKSVSNVVGVFKAVVEIVNKSHKTLDLIISHSNKEKDLNKLVREAFEAIDAELNESGRSKETPLLGLYKKHVEEITCIHQQVGALFSEFVSAYSGESLQTADVKKFPDVMGNLLEILSEDGKTQVKFAISELSKFKEAELPILRKRKSEASDEAQQNLLKGSSKYKNDGASAAGPAGAASTDSQGDKNVALVSILLQDLFQNKSVGILKQSILLRKGDIAEIFKVQINDKKTSVVKIEELAVSFVKALTNLCSELSVQEVDGLLNSMLEGTQANFHNVKNRLLGLEDDECDIEIID